ncbi:hypothetical protein [Microbulbifer pacificus]|uniref:Uncharacterized protein n=1 Tax=Microbulbifer pacificus TaxID=407164 RepID=A0AAU0MWM9_9GAMM|nr:hypothetical protein [Microbulbifer pacificus]WOX05020.1 hypothetical protein R5R33_14920 [Microbulbifer pacificus]
MSGRKKNRRHQNGQPPHELLRELSSLRELLGSDMEADIPLLDQVAEPTSDQKVNNAQQHTTPPRAPSYAPTPPQRPLTEIDLPILFSPIDEELLDDFDDYSTELSEADLKLLRPLQDLPKPAPERDEARKPVAEPWPVKNDTQPTPQQTSQGNTQRTATVREEFQPELFDIEQEQAPESLADLQLIEPAPAEPAAKPANTATQPATRTSAQIPSSPSSPKVTTVSMTENPFLPPHIRARLTGGKIPRPDPIPAVTPAYYAAPAKPEAAAGTNRKLSDEERERLLEQLVAEQLPELERQLRLSISMMLNELYPKKS